MHTYTLLYKKARMISPWTTRPDSFTYDNMLQCLHLQQSTAIRRLRLHDASAINLIPRQMFVNEDVSAIRCIRNVYTTHLNGHFLTYNCIAYEIYFLFCSQFDRNFTIKGEWLDSEEGEDYVEEQKPQKWRHIAEIEVDLLRENPKPPKPVPAWIDDNDEVNMQYAFMN